MPISQRFQAMLDRAKQAGITEIVLQHNDFMAIWSNNIDWAVRECCPGGGAAILAQGIRLRSSWQLPKTDPLWEGHTLYDPHGPETLKMRTHWPWIVKASTPISEDRSSSSAVGMGQTPR